MATRPQDIQRSEDAANAGEAPAPSARDSLSAHLKPDAYLTDGTHLYRVLLACPGGRPVVTLEDCRTLDLLLCPLKGIDKSRLRPVRRGG